MIEPEKRQAIKQLSLREQEYGHKRYGPANFRHDIEITKYGTYKAMKEMGLLLPCQLHQRTQRTDAARQQYLHKPEGDKPVVAGRFYGVSDTGIWNLLLNECAGLLLKICACLSDKGKPSYSRVFLWMPLRWQNRRAQSILGEGCFP